MLDVMLVDVCGRTQEIHQNLVINLEIERDAYNEGF